MTHIVAIGGGEIGRPGTQVETLEIDKQIVALSGKQKPMALFLPTASGDSQSYAKVFKQHYGERLGCEIEVLNLCGNPSTEKIKKTIEDADIIYVGGGNTLNMMTLWRRKGVDKLLEKAYQNGTIVCGLSAGAICWFSAGLSDSRSFTSRGKRWDYIKVKGLGFTNIMLCPHFDAESNRQPALKNALKGTRKVAIAIDNCAALEIKDNKFRILSSKKGAKAYKTYWKDGKYLVKNLEPSTAYQPLNNILS